ncbi:DUF4148 domain-containing protein [Burkholderia sp. 3C]
MKTISGIFLAAWLAIPGLASAQQYAPLTRAQVVAELADLVAAGYNPRAGVEEQHPGNIVEAERKLVQQRAASAGEAGAKLSSAEVGARRRTPAAE